MNPHRRRTLYACCFRFFPAAPLALHGHVATLHGLFDFGWAVLRKGFSHSRSWYCRSHSAMAALPFAPLHAPDATCTAMLYDQP
eukprot:5124911-Prymnesium_polylepis.1